jgi:hypothetical protein
MKMPATKNIKGLVFGRLTAIKRAANKGTSVAWLCECTCGAQTTVRASALTSAVTKSCGCLQKEVAANANPGTHGKTGTPEYSSWQNMKNRCNNSNYPEFHLYGGRGIKVCKRWSSSFESFLLDMGKKPSSKHSIDRVNTNNNYSPTNCRWATPTEQADNRRSNHLITYNGKTQNLKQWSEDLGILLVTLKWRLKRWPVDKALSLKPRPKLSKQSHPLQGSRAHQPST